MTVVRDDSLAGLRASLRLFKGALRGVIHSPISFYDTPPLVALEVFF